MRTQSIQTDYGQMFFGPYCPSASLDIWIELLGTLFSITRRHVESEQWSSVNVETGYPDLDKLILVHVQLNHSLYHRQPATIQISVCGGPLLGRGTNMHPIRLRIG